MRERRTLADMRGRRNGLNVVRLLLAAMVLISHSFPLGGFGVGPTIGGTNLGTLAVFGFFGLSGYLITGSRLRTTSGRYLWHRALRIAPAFWVMLLGVAFVLAPIAGWLAGGGYSVASAARFVLNDLGVLMRQVSIGGTLADAPFDNEWNGAAWTLIFELACYVLVLAFGAARLLRSPAGLLATFAVAAVVSRVHPGPYYQLQVGPAHLSDLVNLLLPFTAGAVLFLVRQHIPIRGDLMVVALALIVVALIVMSSPALVVAFPMTYLLLSLGALIRLPDLLARNDLSYGLYIWAWPLQQLAYEAGVARRGVVLYMLMCLAIALGMAALSWRLIERPALKMKDYSPLRDSRAPAPYPGTGANWGARGADTGGHLPPTPPVR